MPKYVLLMILLLLGTACVREPDVVETRSDLERYVKTAPKDFKLLLERIKYLAAEEVNRVGSIPPDFERFLDWRKREWWNLQEEFAYHIKYDWDIVAKLVEDVARFHGYEVQNFPKAEEDILRFFVHHTKTEWHNLVMDAVIFVEYNSAEGKKMLKWLKYQYEMVDWEVTNLVTDWRMFLQWRKEAYALQANFKDFFDHEINLVDDFKRDLDRFRIINIVNAGNVVVDFRNFFIGHTLNFEVPRLYDDVQRYFRRQPGEYRLAADSLKRYAKTNMKDFGKLYDRVKAYKAGQLDHLKSALAQADAFFKFYEREFEPLNEDVKRWWRYNILKGRVLIDELKDFYEQEKIAAYELKIGAKRFVSYGGVEWERLKEGWQRFVSGKGVAYGTYDIPSDGDYGTRLTNKALKQHEPKYKTGR